MSDQIFDEGFVKPSKHNTESVNMNFEWQVFLRHSCYNVIFSISFIFTVSFIIIIIITFFILTCLVIIISSNDLFLHVRHRFFFLISLSGWLVLVFFFLLLLLVYVQKFPLKNCKKKIFFSGIFLLCE